MSAPAGTGTGHRTSSIPRPRRVPGLGRARSGRSNSDEGVGDDTRLIQRRRNRHLMTFGAAVIVAALAASLLVLPVRAWLNQRTELAERARELATLEAANRRIEAANARLQTPQGVEEAARNDLGYLEIGEQQLTVLPAPATGDLLPGRWPYTIVTEIFSVRAADAAATAAAAAAAATTPAPTPAETSTP